MIPLVLRGCDLAAPLRVCGLALFSTVLWGVAPVVVKRAFSRGATPLQAAVVIISVDATVLWVVTTALRGPGAVLALAPRVAAAFALAGVMATATGRIIVYAGIDRLGAAINMAGVATRPLFATVIGVVALGEAVGATTLAGVGVLTGGLVVLALSKGGDVGGWRRLDFAFPLTAAGLYAAGNAVRRTGLSAHDGSALAAATVNETAAVVAVVAYAVARGRKDDLVQPRGTYGLLAFAGLLTAMGMVTLFAALDHPGGRVVIVDPLVAAAPLFTTVCAYFLLGDVERITRGIAAGTGIIVAGAALVTLG